MIVPMAIGPHSLSDLSFMQLASAGFFLFFVSLFTVLAVRSVMRRYSILELIGWSTLAVLAIHTLGALMYNVSEPLGGSMARVFVPALFALVLFGVFVAMTVRRIVQYARNPRESRLSAILLWLGFASMAAAVLLSSSAVITLTLFLSEYTGVGYILLRGDWIAAAFVVGLLVAGAGGVWLIVTRRNLRIRNAHDAAEMRIALANQGTSQIGQ